MFTPGQSNWKNFLHSPHHIWLAALTLGIGFVSAHAGLFLLGMAAYALGWVYLPDSSMFKKWVESKEAAINSKNSSEAAQAFIARRDALISSLSHERSERYCRMAAVCAEIERATRESSAGEDGEVDLRLRKLDELMWTYLRLLVLEASLQQFLDTEKAERIPEALSAGQAEVDQLDAEIKAAVARGETPTSKIRLLDSRRERLETLKKRQDRVNESTENLKLVSAEQDRLVEQIKLLRADSIAAKNTEALTARIDATVEHLSQTNKLFAEMDQFKDLVAEDLPQTTERLGFALSSPRAHVPPVIPVRTK